MDYDIVIRNGLVIAPTGRAYAAVGIRDGRIVEVGDCRGSATEEVDAKNKLVFPGCIDPHTHLQNNRGSDDSMSKLILEESAGAAIGGVTTMATTTIIGTEPLVEHLAVAKRICSGHSYVDYRLTLQPLVSQHINEMAELTEQGSNLYKFYLGFKGAEAEHFGMPSSGLDLGFVYRGFKMLAQCDGSALALVHAEEPYLGDEFRKVAMAGDKADLEAWNTASPSECEMIDIYKAAVVAESVGCRLYIVHVSSGRSVELLRTLRNQNYELHAETCLHYLVLNDTCGLGSLAKCKPPIRRDQDVSMLWAGLKDGTVGIVGTDTVPYKRSYKEVDFWDAPNGTGSSIGLLLPVMFSEGVMKRGFAIEQLANVIAGNAARALGVYPKKGAIGVGCDADIVIIDPDAEVTVRASNLRSGSDYSIYEGMRIRGLPEKTLIRGKLVADRGEIVAEQPAGQFVGSV